MAEVLALVPDLLFGSKIEATLRAAGHDVKLVQRLDREALQGTQLIVADLNEVDEPEELKSTGLPVLGFYAHLDVALRERAEACGVDLVVPRSRMAREMPELVAALLSGD